ncbi:hypothetical protein [Marivirga sp.]|uniref:hypothetical protein n=1 Tax=Marivirga sp. TaxID=2018662 RepID=UPI002D7E2620|nr:hypothetical protein [Marivirga sp.]HET8859410.1 hypothetical protein [Marivirga sp.]
MYKSIKIEYWTFPEGQDFHGIEEFVDEIDKDYFLTISKKRTDALGGGLYHLIIEIQEDLSLVELAKSYVEDGIKLYIGYQAKDIYKTIKKLFDKNKNLKPSVEQISVKFKDCNVIFYEIYENAIEENFESVITELIKAASEHKKIFKKAKEVHIPIFNQKDIYNICDYRVKLNVDENMTDFRKADFLKLWGIKFKKKHIVYNVQKNKMKKKKFYTQSSYNKLFDREFKNGKIK